MFPDLRAAYDTLCSRALIAEQAALPPLLERACLPPGEQEKAQALAREFAEHTRAHLSPFGIEAFLQRFTLDSDDGVQLLRLAEALLRVPDEATAQALLRDTVGEAAWQDARPAPWPAALSGQALGMAQRLLRARQRHVSEASGKAILRATRLGVRWLGGKFVIGETIEAARRRARAWKRQGYGFSYDMLGESARTDAQALAFTERYLHAVAEVGKDTDRSKPLAARDGISVKLSALDPRYEAVQADRCRERLLPRLAQIVQAAKEAGIPVTIDAEEANRLELSLELFAELAMSDGIREFEGLGLAVQAYQLRASDTLTFITKLAEQRGTAIPVRLVKGAYWDSEIKHAQMLGLEGFPVFTRKCHTDVSYLACARQMLDADGAIYPQFATHNALTLAQIITMAGGRAVEFQRLHGMGEALYEKLVGEGKATCRIYAPVGPQEDLLAYLIRRLLENGANSSFVHAIGDPSVSMDALLSDPVRETRIGGLAPAPHIRAPRDLFDERDNAPGYELNYRATRQQLMSAPPVMTELPTPVSPNDAVTAAENAFTDWSRLTADARATILERAATLLEEHRDTALRLLTNEAGKSWGDAIGEWREAQDFLRYYAAQARQWFGAPISLPGPTAERNLLHWHGRGVFVCISPWNFPLAIFTGQVAAALAAGNSVVAKPAEQTPRTAQLMTRLLHEAGVPLEALQLVTGQGGSVGKALVEDARIAGVAFTGSTETAWAINASLAARRGPIIPLIAETGGQNAMIVDSTALLEQTVGHAVLSAFGSAGQRCSALRVLYVQQDVLPRMKALLEGAMKELRVGDPSDIATDVGPVIDRAAWERLSAHIARFSESTRWQAKTPLPGALPEGHYFIAPHVFEIGSIRELPGEMFGPVLHVIGYDAARLGEVLEEIGSTGYGLTLGIETRLRSRIHAISNHARVGNIYINRAMTGAVVGVQPFGGEGLSGTGPKAGGPHYLLRFATERVVSENMAAFGGNIDLLTGK